MYILRQMVLRSYAHGDLFAGGVDWCCVVGLDE